MSLLSVVKDVCAGVGILIPTSVFSNVNNVRTMQEMLSLANEMAQRIAYNTREWTLLKEINVITGDGTTASFSMPADYQRMLVSSNIWRSTSAIHPMRFIPDTDDWIQRRALKRINAWGEWTIMGGKIYFWPVLAAGVTATFAYLNKNCIALASGGAGTTFQSDADSFALEERLLKLGMIWQWKASKGGAYAEDMGTWSDALNVAEGADQPAPILINRAPISALSTTANIAYPFPAPYPYP
jgi:hypothetical protein